MTKKFSEFYDFLLPELHGISTGMLDLQLLRVSREFCERSTAWRAPLLPISSEAEQRVYALFSPEPKSDVVRITELRVGGVLQWRANAREQDEEEPRWEPGEPPFVVNELKTLLTLDEQPTGEIEGQVAMRPSLTANELPNILLTDYLEALCAGVLARLMDMGGKPWTDRAKAATYEIEYRRALNKHATMAARGNTRAPLRTRKTVL